MPGRAYALGFLRSYADYLGFDGEDLVAGSSPRVADLTDQTRLRDPHAGAREPSAQDADRGDLARGDRRRLCRLGLPQPQQPDGRRDRRRGAGRSARARDRGVAEVADWQRRSPARGACADERRRGSAAAVDARAAPAPRRQPAPADPAPPLPPAEPPRARRRGRAPCRPASPRRRSPRPWLGVVPSRSRCSRRPASVPGARRAAEAARECPAPAAAGAGPAAAEPARAARWRSLLADPTAGDAQPQVDDGRHASRA